MSDSIMSSQDRETAHSLFKLWGDSYQKTLSTIAGHEVKLTNCSIETLELNKFMEKLGGRDAVVQELIFSRDVLGKAFIVAPKAEAMLLIDLIIGSDGTSVVEEFGELHHSIFTETTSQMAISLSGIIGNSTSKRINIAPGDAKLNDFSAIQSTSIAELYYDVDIEGKAKGSLWVLFPPLLVKNLATILQESKAAIHSPSADYPADIRKVDKLAQPPAFEEFAPAREKTKGDNIELILDIPINVKAVLGKSQITLKELIEITPGTILELDKLAGDPVDLHVNDRLIARGEIVVIDEKFGVKVVDVLSKAERLYNLK